jgi:hypothetical protein
LTKSGGDSLFGQIYPKLPMNIAFPKLVRYTYFSSLLPLAFCLKPITFVPQQTEKRDILSAVVAASTVRT